MTAPNSEQSWNARPSKATQRLVYVGLALLGLVAGFMIGYAATYRQHADKLVKYVIMTVPAAALLSWLGGRLLLRALQRAGVFGVVRVSGERLTIGRAGTAFDLAKPVKVDPRSHFTHFERDVTKGISGEIRHGRVSHEWVWNASLQVAQEGQWATLTADDWSGILKRKSREAKEGADDPWAGLEVKSVEPGPPRGTTLRLAPDDFAQVLRALQACVGYRSFRAEAAPGAPAPHRLLTGLKTAIGVAALLAVSFIVVALAHQHYGGLGREASRQEQQERDKARKEIETLWKPRIGRWVKLVRVSEAIVFGRVTGFEAGETGHVSLTIGLEVVEDSTGNPDPTVRIGGRDVKKGDVAYVGGDAVAFEEPPADLLRRPPGGLTRMGWAKLQQILGDRMGRPLTAEEQEDVLTEFRLWTVANSPRALADLAAASELLSKPLPKPDAGDDAPAK